MNLEEWWQHFVVQLASHDHPFIAPLIRHVVDRVLQCLILCLESLRRLPQSLCLNEGLPGQRQRSKEHNSAEDTSRNTNGRQQNREESENEIGKRVLHWGVRYNLLHDGNWRVTANQRSRNDNQGCVRDAVNCKGHERRNDHLGHWPTSAPVE